MTLFRCDADGPEGVFLGDAAFCLLPFSLSRETFWLPAIGFVFVHHALLFHYRKGYMVIDIFIAIGRKKTSQGKEA